MANLEVVQFAGVASFQGSFLQFVDGPPVASKTITTSGDLYGSPNTPTFVKMTPIGGDCTLTWPNGSSETIRGPEYRGTRGETVSVS